MKLTSSDETAIIGAVCMAWRPRGWRISLKYDKEVGERDQEIDTESSKGTLCDPAIEEILAFSTFPNLNLSFERWTWGSGL